MRVRFEGCLATGVTAKDMILHLIAAYGAAGAAGKAIEFAGWFLVYVLVVPTIGYLLATLLFCLLLTWRLGYRSKSRLVAAALTGLAVVLVFKSMLSVKIPGGEIYEFLPAALRNFMILNF